MILGYTMCIMSAFGILSEKQLLLLLLLGVLDTCLPGINIMYIGFPSDSVCANEVIMT